VVAEGDSAGETRLGIYGMKKGGLKICFAQPDKPRPTAFSAKEGSGNTLVILKRPKQQSAQLGRAFRHRRSAHTRRGL
jgi:hypothetical protein